MHKRRHRLRAGLAAAITVFCAMASLVAATPAAAAAPDNDDLAAATAISGTSGTLLGSNLDATNEAGEPSNHVFDCCTGVDVASSVWYSWTAPGSGPVSFDTEGSRTSFGLDTVLAVYTGSTIEGLSEVGFNDDDGSHDSYVTFDATQGVEYRIAVGGCCGIGGETGSFSLRWSYVERPENDDFDLATDIVGASGAVSGSTTYASPEAGEPAVHQFPDPDLGGRSVWYRWTAPADGVYEFHLSPSDRSVGAYTGSFDALTEVAHLRYATEPLMFEATSGVTYSIGIGSSGWSNGVYPGPSGPFTLAWEPFVDTIAPNTLITATAPGKNSFAVSFVGSDDTTSPESLRFECMVDDTEWSSCASPATFSGIPGGLHTIAVRAVDEGGNADSTPATAEIRVRGRRSLPATTARTR